MSKSHLLTMPSNTKNRPHPSWLTGSTIYLALRGQLAVELPIYVRLLLEGLSVVVCRLGEIQTWFWRDVRNFWVGLWESLRVDDEVNVGREGTCAVWRARWADVDQRLGSLVVTRPVQDLFTKFVKEKDEKEDVQQHYHEYWVANHFSSKVGASYRQTLALHFLRH